MTGTVNRGIIGEPMTVLREILAHFAVTTDTKQVEALDKRVKGAQTGLERLGQAATNVGARLRDANGRFVRTTDAVTAAAGRFYDANGRLREANGRFVTGAEAAGAAAQTAAGALHTFGIASLFSAYGAFRTAAGAVDLARSASDVNEDLNVLRETFKGSADGVLAWAEATATAVGRNEFTLRKSAGSFGAFLSPMIASKPKIAEMSQTLAQLAVDLGSFYNMSDEQAAEKLFSGIAGETEAVRRLGIDLSDAGLQEFARARGIAKKVQTMSQAEKTELRYQKILVDTKEKQGDAARTADGYANTTKRLKETLGALSVALGNKLLVPLTRLVQGLESAASWLTWVATKTKLLEAALLVTGLAVSAFATRWVLANQTMLLSFMRTWGPIIARFALAGAGVLVVILAVEDLITLFDGGKSAIGTFVDELFGIGTAEEVVISIKQSFDELFYSISKAGEALGLMEAGASPEQLRESRRNEAIRNGDADAFVRERAAGRSREEGLQDFLASRERYLAQNPNAATARDVGSGLATQAGSAVSGVTQLQAVPIRAPSVSVGPVSVTAPRSRAPVTYAPTTTIQVNLPAGDDRAQAERLRKVVQEETARGHRQALASLRGQATP